MKANPLTKPQRMGNLKHKPYLSNDPNFADSWDMFATRIPSLNIEGQDKIGSGLGLVATVFLTVTVLTYAAVKMNHLVIKHNPTVSESTNLDFYDKTDAINLNDKKMVFAFAVESFYNNRKEIISKDYVTWQPMIVESDGEANDKYTYLEFRKCIDEDWKKFYSPSKKNMKKI